MRRNHCCLNHPRPICCPFSLDCDSNQVVNPVISSQFGFFNNPNPQTVSSDGIIEVFLREQRGSSITQSPNVSGAVRLLPGIYEISYFANAELPEDGNLSVKLQANGIDVPGSVVNLQDTGLVSLSQTLAFTAQETVTLELINNSNSTIVFSNASIMINRL